MARATDPLPPFPLCYCPACNLPVSPEPDQCPHCKAAFGRGDFYCGECKEAVGPQDLSCDSCGASFSALLDYECPKCRAPLSKDSRSCVKCGARFVNPTKRWGTNEKRSRAFELNSRGFFK
ncbi:MAG TPA: zinc ribbon domain-containing protein [Thermoplasmata archaeon]|nr:zinc ribbon domain-containing protein [Thermoplasmata archaeon]